MKPVFSNDVESACRRLSLAGALIQSFLADSLDAHGLSATPGRKTVQVMMAVHLFVCLFCSVLFCSVLFCSVYLSVLFCLPVYSVLFTCLFCSVHLSICLFSFVNSLNILCCLFSLAMFICLSSACSLLYIHQSRICFHGCSVLFCSSVCNFVC